MIKIYLDWNVISNIHQIDILKRDEDKSTYSQLRNIIVAGREKYILPYSNAHLNDLLKRFKNGNHQELADSLSFIKEFTQEVCLTQYWNDTEARWHHRNPHEYFDVIIEEMEDEESSKGLDDLFEPLKEFGMDRLFDLFKVVPHNMNFPELSKASPIFTELFRRSQHDSSMYAVMEDLYELSQGTNPAIYNGLCSLFKNSIPLDPNVHNVENVIGLLDQTMPKTMINKSFTELYMDNNKSEMSKNEDYSKIVGVFMQLDFVGYGSDKLTDKNPYANLFNDALHCFYAAHCDFFVTADKKALKKTKAVYQSEGINTVVMKPAEFVDFISEPHQ